jgi:isopentenyl-diphosphate delta-isomerase
MSEHAPRKSDHLDLCATDEVKFRAKDTLFDEVELVHDALPELALDEVDLSTRLCGKLLRAPLIIAAMTGGIERAASINRDLASVAQECGLGFGFGSMRPLFDDPRAPGYRVRDVAPDILLLGNIGVVQARVTSAAQIIDTLGETGCDALCVHLNPAMEIIQSGGDRDFRGGLDTIIRLREELPVPIIVKETGCGLSRAVALRLVSAGVRWVDTSGAGGTSWVGVETLRARARSRAIGDRFWDWGIPTAASIAQLSGLGLGTIATGGVRHGLDVARAIALGAAAGGIARPFLSAWNEGGRDAALAEAHTIVEELRMAFVLTGSRRIDALRAKRLVLGSRLLSWVPSDSPLRGRLLDV